MTPIPEIPITGESHVQFDVPLDFSSLTPTGVFIVVDDLVRVILAAQLHDLIDVQAEQEKVRGANGFADFDIGSIQSPDRNGAVHHELHVARS